MEARRLGAWCLGGFSERRARPPGFPHIYMHGGRDFPIYICTEAGISPCIYTEAPWAPGRSRPGATAKHPVPFR